MKIIQNGGCSTDLVENILDDIAPELSVVVLEKLCRVEPGWRKKILPLLKTSINDTDALTWIAWSEETIQKAIAQQDVSVVFAVDFTVSGSGSKTQIKKVADYYHLTGYIKTTGWETADSQRYQYISSSKAISYFFLRVHCVVQGQASQVELFIRYVNLKPLFSINGF